MGATGASSKRILYTAFTVDLLNAAAIGMANDDGDRLLNIFEVA